MTEQVSFIPYSVVAATMAIEHRLAGGVKLEKIQPPLETEWVRPVQLSRPGLKDRQPYFVFTTATVGGVSWEVTMYPDRSDESGMTGVGSAELKHEPPPKPRVQRTPPTPAM
jgi:hypothetical protein